MAMSVDQQDEQEKAYGRVVARAWADTSFKQRFLREPAAVLREFGIHIPEGMQVQAHEASGTVGHVVLPPKPADLSDEQLAQIAGGRLPVKIAHWTLSDFGVDTQPG